MSCKKKIYLKYVLNFGGQLECTSSGVSERSFVFYGILYFLRYSDDNGYNGLTSQSLELISRSVPNNNDKSCLINS